MPRRTRVHDEIRPDQETAPPDMEDEESEIVATTKAAVRKNSKKTKVKHERDATNQNDFDATAANGADTEIENDAFISFDKESFLATTRPISRGQVENVDRVIRDLHHLTTQVENVGFDLVTDAAMAIAEASGDSKDGEELDLLMRNLIDAQEEIKAHGQSLDDLKQRILCGELINDLENAYIVKATELKINYAKKTARQKYARHDKYFNFREQVWEVNHEDPMPPLNALIPREEEDSEDDSDIEVGGKTQDYKCPLSLRMMEDPVTAPCGHSFSMEAIKDYLQNGRKQATCPATGCDQLLVLSDLKSNERLARRIVDRIRRDRRKEDERDEGSTQAVDVD